MATLNGSSYFSLYFMAQVVREINLLKVGGFENMQKAIIQNMQKAGDCQGIVQSNVLKAGGFRILLGVVS